jgi:hypothetical protein
MTNLTTETLSEKLKTLKVEVLDTNECRQEYDEFKYFHICTASINRTLNEAVCEVSNIIRDLLKHLIQFNTIDNLQSTKALQLSALNIKRLVSKKLLICPANKLGW